MPKAPIVFTIFTDHLLRLAFERAEREGDTAPEKAAQTRHR
jgi:hypothetical protein